VARGSRTDFFPIYGEMDAPYFFLNAALYCCTSCPLAYADHVLNWRSTRFFILVYSVGSLGFEGILLYYTIQAKKNVKILKTFSRVCVYMITRTFSAKIPFKDATKVFESAYILDCVHGKGRWTFGPWKDDGPMRIRRGKISSVDVPEPFTIFNAGKPTITCNVKQTLISSTDTEIVLTSTLKPKVSGMSTPIKNKTWFTIRDDESGAISVYIESKNSCYLPPPFKSMGVEAMDLLSVETIHCLEDACYRYANDMY